jgi:multiple sugar transport system permease protein/putative chitobiose transport system permease protein
MSTAQQRALRSLNLVIAIICAVSALAPLYWAAVGGFRHESDIFRYMDPPSWRTFVPSPATLDNLAILREAGFFDNLVHSMIVTVLSVGLGLVVSVPAAFALAVLRFRGRNFWFVLIVFTFLVPFDSIAIPLASMFRTLNLQDSYTGLVLPGLANGLVVFQLRQFFQGIPTELIEAARLDGLGWWGVLGRIFIPLSKPALVSAGMLLFVFSWQSYLWPLLIAPSPEYTLAPIAIAQFNGDHTVAYGAIFLAATITAMIPLVPMLAAQRFFTTSLATSGIK